MSLLPGPPARGRGPRLGHSGVGTNGSSSPSPLPPPRPLPRRTWILSADDKVGTPSLTHRGSCEWGPRPGGLGSGVPRRENAEPAGARQAGPRRPHHLGTKRPVRCSRRPSDLATPGIVLCLPGSRVGGEARGGSRAWLHARPAAFGPGATGAAAPASWRRAGPDGSAGAAMGSLGSHAARIPDADSIRQETGCERGAGFRPGDAGRGGWGWGGPGGRPGSQARAPGAPGVQVWGPSGAPGLGSPAKAGGQVSSSPAGLGGGEGGGWPRRLGPRPAGAREHGSGRRHAPCSPAARPRVPGERPLRRVSVARPRPGAAGGGSGGGSPAPARHPSALRPAVSQASLLRLYHRFRALDRNKKGYLR